MGVNLNKTYTTTYKRIFLFIFFQDFDKDLKSWFKKLISLHLRLATKEDHWFLLFNILRCPSGVGAWASEFLQVPCNSKDLTPVASTPTAHTNEVPLKLNSPEIGHCMSVLQVLLMPIKKRNEYLKQFTQVNNTKWDIFKIHTKECIYLCIYYIFRRVTSYDFYSQSI